jgi:small-conductance mechanosensitive channel
LTDEDALLYGKSRQEIATERLKAIREAIEGYRERRTPEARSRAIVYALVGGAMMILLFIGLRRLHRRLMAWVEARRSEGRALRFQQRLVVDPENFARYQKRAIKALEWGAGLLLTLVYLEVLFSVFPLTRAFGIGLLRYVLEPVGTLWRGFLGQVDNLFTIAVIVILTRYLLKGLKWLHQEAAAGEIHLPGIHPEWAMPIYKLLRLAVIALAAVIIYPYIPGSDSAAFKGISIFLGVVVSLGSSGAAGQFIGGLVLMSMKPFRIGDRVEVGGVTGDVVAISMAFTRVRTIKNEEVTVPNGQVLSGKLVNYSGLARESGLILHTSVTIGYDAPWRTVHELLVRAALRTDGILVEPAPFVLQTALNDFYVTYEINAYTREANEMANLYARLHQNIQDSFNEGGVEIMSAHYAYLRDGNAATIPEKYRPEGYRPPSFGVRVDKDDGS